MIDLILWYLTITVLGLIAFPLLYEFVPSLPDRGYALSRILGLLLWGYIFWLFGSLDLVRNDVGGMLIALMVVVSVSVWALLRVGWVAVWRWLTSQHKMIVIVESLFLVTFVGWAFIRAANPEIVGTEKPMELAFINAILRSPSLPPHDPWLSGFSISYYYFGYVLIAMMARVAGTSGSVAFNLGVSLVFSLSAVGAYSILYNLLKTQKSSPINKYGSNTCKNVRFSALLGPFFILIVSNLGGFLHILRLLGVFWQKDESGQWVSRLWRWLDIGRYAQPPPNEAFPHWWWWQASRIVQDFDFNWLNKGDIIDEFPFFSYLLADLHPHVLAMPFALLAISLALNLFLGGAGGETRWFFMRFKINPHAFALSAVVLGSLAFFNTWDFPFYVALFAGAYILKELLSGEEVELTSTKWSLWRILKELIRLGFALGVSGFFLYLPFYFTFQSQAGGPLPNLIYITRGVYLWIHFMPLLIPIFGLLLFLWRVDGNRSRLRSALLLMLGFVGFLLSLALFLTVIIANLQFLDSVNPQAGAAAGAFLGSTGAPSFRELVVEGFWRRLTVPGTLLTILTILCFTAALLWPRNRKKTEQEVTTLSKSHLFTLLLILVGALLVLAPEFVFLRDLFGYRINTIFKFYFQVWLMWGIAAAFGVVHLWFVLKAGNRILFQMILSIVLVLSLTYPVMGLWSKTNGFKPGNGFTLDGAAYLQSNNPDEYAAMQWLMNAPLGVIAEAVGGSYSLFARMASHSGQPAVLGWDFHELQWRGGTTEMGSRRVDIERLYCTARWEETERILRQYHVRYVVVGTMEITAYGSGSSACPSGLNAGKFDRNLSLAFQSGGTSIYLVPEVIEMP